MPRYVDRTRRPANFKDRVERQGRQRFFKRDWVDPYPTVMGTRPEKIVYEQLMARGINFYFQSMVLVNLPLLDISKEYRPDFVLPDLGIIIEVQGVYFHSKPESIESDAYKQALYNLMGYEVLAWWDYEIEADVTDLFVRHPKLAGLMGTGGRILTGKEKNIDDLKGLRTTNARRFRAKTAKVRTPRGRKTRVLSRYEAKR